MLTGNTRTHVRTYARIHARTHTHARTQTRTHTITIQYSNISPLYCRNGLTEVHFCVIPPYNSQIDPEELLDPDDDQVKKGLAVVHMSPYMAESSSGPEVKNVMTYIISDAAFIGFLAVIIIIIITIIITIIIIIIIIIIVVIIKSSSLMILYFCNSCHFVYVFIIK